MISRMNKAKTSRTTGISAAAVLANPWMADPEALTKTVQESLLSLTEEQRAAYNRRLIETLGEMGLNVPAILYISGVVEQEPGDLTPPEVAHLFRYIRINVPWVLVEAEDLFAGLDQHKERRQTRREAA